MNPILCGPESCNDCTCCEYSLKNIKLEFVLTDENRVIWGARIYPSGDIWLLRKGANGLWITIRTLQVWELEQYQKLAGCYPRS